LNPEGYLVSACRKPIRLEQQIPDDHAEQCHHLISASRLAGFELFPRTTRAELRELFFESAPGFAPGLNEEEPSEERSGNTDALARVAAPCTRSKGIPAAFADSG